MNLLQQDDHILNRVTNHSVRSFYVSTSNLNRLLTATFFPCTFRLCTRTPACCLNFIPHRSQLWFFSVKWMVLCSFKYFLVRKLDWQMSHLKGFSPETELLNAKPSTIVSDIFTCMYTNMISQRSWSVENLTTCWTWTLGHCVIVLSHVRGQSSGHHECFSWNVRFNVWVFGDTFQCYIPQTAHWYGRISLCILMCMWTYEDRENSLPHILHGNLIPVCMCRIWSIKSFFSFILRPQISHSWIDGNQAWFSMWRSR